MYLPYGIQNLHIIKYLNGYTFAPYLLRSSSSELTNTPNYLNVHNCIPCEICLKGPAQTSRLINTPSYGCNAFQPKYIRLHQYTPSVVSLVLSRFRLCVSLASFQKLNKPFAGAITNYIAFVCTYNKLRSSNTPLTCMYLHNIVYNKYLYVGFCLKKGIYK